MFRWSLRDQWETVWVPVNTSISLYSAIAISMIKQHEEAWVGAQQKNMRSASLSMVLFMIAAA